jgi:hypothetical protein
MRRSICLIPRINPFDAQINMFDPTYPTHYCPVKYRGRCCKYKLGRELDDGIGGVDLNLGVKGFAEALDIRHINLFDAQISLFDPTDQPVRCADQRCSRARNAARRARLAESPTDLPGRFTSIGSQAEGSCASAMTRSSIRSCCALTDRADRFREVATACFAFVITASRPSAVRSTSPTPRTAPSSRAAPHRS